MSDDQVRYHFQGIRKHLAALQGKNAEVWQEIDALLEDLHVIYEQMQTALEAAEVVEEGLLQQTQLLAEKYKHYYDLFQSLPIAYLIIDANGVILEANRAIAQLLNVPQRYLPGKPLVSYVAESDRLAFCTHLSQLSQSDGAQLWQMKLQPRDGQPISAEWQIAISQNNDGFVQSLQIGLYHLPQSQPLVTPLVQQQTLENIPAEATISMSRLSQSLDGLQVLVVDDEADARDFIVAALKSYGIGVRAVASATAALEELKRFRPDVLVSDIRMPGEDGYSLIRQIRSLETGQEWHLPAVAITAYLDEDREKALSAGFKAYFHKLSQPIELIEMVVQLAGRTPS